MTYVWLILGFTVYGIALVLVYALMKMARDADREVRHAVAMLTPLADVSVMQSEQDFGPHRNPARSRNWRTSQFALHVTIAAPVGRGPTLCVLRSSRQATRRGTYIHPAQHLKETLWIPFGSSPASRYS